MELFKGIAALFLKRRQAEKHQGQQPAIENQEVQPNRGPACAHGPTPGKTQITVLGVQCEFESLPMCKTCTEQYLNSVCTLCASCERPIFPGAPVGQAWEDAAYPYTHLYFECCDSGGFYCGRWGEGRLITLHELDPVQFPERESSLISHVFNTGNAVIVNHK